MLVLRSDNPALDSTIRKAVTEQSLCTRSWLDNFGRSRDGRQILENFVKRRVIEQLDVN